MLVVGDAVEKGDWEEGELLEFCPHGDMANLGVVFCEPLAIEPVVIGNTGVVNDGEVMEGGAEDGGGREKGGVDEEDEEGEGFMGGRELGFEG